MDPAQPAAGTKDFSHRFKRKKTDRKIAWLACGADTEVRRSMVNHSNVLELIGNTPLVELRTFDTGPCRLFVKLENQNPGGSIKDRIGRSMIEAAIRDGKVGPGSTLVEATAGNTGLGLALIAARKGLRLILVIPDKISQEKVPPLRALVAGINTTPIDGVRGRP